MNAMQENEINDRGDAFRPVAVVTGVGSGIGLAAALGLARAGYALVGVVRNGKRAEETRERILSDVPDARLRLVAGDLGRQREADRICDEILSILQDDCGGRLDRLLYAAGTVTSWYTATEDDYETQFAVNHLAAFRMGLRLREALSASGDGRLLVVSSGSHYQGRMRWHDLMRRRLYHLLAAYMQSKLANVLFVHGFNRRFASDRLRAYAVDPGLVNTDIGAKSTSGLVRRLWDSRRRKGVSPEQGAAEAIRICLAPAAPTGPYDYYKDGHPIRPSAASLRPDAIDRLWTVSERLCGLEGAGTAPDNGKAKRGIEADKGIEARRERPCEAVCS